MQKNLNYWIECHEILYRHLWCSEDESCDFDDPLPFSCSAMSEFIVVV